MSTRDQSARQSEFSIRLRALIAFGRPREKWQLSDGPFIADRLKPQTVDHLGPPHLGQSDPGDGLSKRSAIGAHQRDRSQDSGYTDHQRRRTEPEKADGMPRPLALKLEREAPCRLSREHQIPATERMPCPSSPFASHSLAARRHPEEGQAAGDRSATLYNLGVFFTSHKLTRSIRVRPSLVDDIVGTGQH